LIVECTENGLTVDCTREVIFGADSPAVVRVSPDGVVTPVGDGTAAVTATLAGRLARATVRVVAAPGCRP
jgi:hypothetical protein